MPNHDLETVAYIYDKPWRSNTTQTNISASPKDIAVEEHIQLLTTIINPSGHLYTNTDGSKLDNGHTGTGSILYQYNEPNIEMSVPMGDECEVYDAELNAIALTSEKMEKIVKNKQTNIKNIWIFCDSQAAINRINHLRIGPG
jgi:hypothetical protein